MFKCLRMVQPGSFLLSIRAKPGAKTSEFVGPLVPSESAVEIRVAAPPVEGAANEELVSFLEDSLDGAHRRGGWDSSANASAAADASNNDPSDYTAKKKDKGKGGGENAKGKSAAQLPTKVRVSFHSGSTSRSKVIALELPCESLEKAWSLLVAASNE